MLQWLAHVTPLSIRAWQDQPFHANCFRCDLCRCLLSSTTACRTADGTLECAAGCARARQRSIGRASGRDTASAATALPHADRLPPPLEPTALSVLAELPVQLAPVAGTLADTSAQSHDVVSMLQSTASKSNLHDAMAARAEPLAAHQFHWQHQLQQLQLQLQQQLQTTTAQHASLRSALQEVIVVVLMFCFKKTCNSVGAG